MDRYVFAWRCRQINNRQAENYNCQAKPYDCQAKIYNCQANFYNLYESKNRKFCPYNKKGSLPVGPRILKKRSDHMGNLLKIYFETRWIRFC